MNCLQFLNFRKKKFHITEIYQYFNIIIAPEFLHYFVVVVDDDVVVVIIIITVHFKLVKSQFSLTECRDLVEECLPS